MINTYDAILAFRNSDGELGTSAWAPSSCVANAMLLWVYTLSCHSCRHIIGGRLKHFSKHPVRYRIWTFISRLNPHHTQFAWLSLFGVAFTDFYVRAARHRHDLRPHVLLDASPTAKGS